MEGNEVCWGGVRRLVLDESLGSSNTAPGFHPGETGLF